MKQMLKTGKKALSVFMAVMMVLTAWVWVAPTEASAATAGTYDVKVRIQTTDSVDVGDSKDLTLTLNYKKDNGAGSAGTPKTNNVSYTWANNDNADNTWTITGLDGYPTSFSVYCLYAWTAAIQRVWGCTIYISVKDNDTDTWTEVAKQSFSESGGSWGQTEKTYTISNIGGTPEATRVTFLSGAESIDIPKTGESNVTKTYTAGVYDQYGVRMTYEPTYYVRSTAPTSAQTSSSSITGVSMSSSTSSGTMTVTSSAQNTSADTKNVYVHAKYGSVYANKTVALNDPSYTFTYDKNTTDSATISPSSNTSKKYYNTFGDTAISGTRTGFTFKGFYQSAFDDSYETEEFSGTALSSSTRYTADTDWYAAWQANKYKLTFNYKDENYTDQTYVVDEYYGRTYDMPSYPEVIEIKENGITNFKYEFNGWKINNSFVTPPLTIPNENITYLADYKETTYYADKTNLNNAIAVAEAKLNEQQYIDGGYTEESVAAFESALQQADDALGMLYYLSQQSALDLITNNLVTATNNLTTKKYIVMFVDEDGTILKGGYHFVEYGDSVAVPANPEQEPDADYHYEFVEWNSNLSDGLSACNYVTDNLRYIATFDAKPHTFTETTTPSTCTADGVITYTCDCGYSYTAVNSADLAHHTWSTDYKELVPATCATKGSEAKYCTACGAIDESTRREIAELGHAFGAYTEYTPATCFGKGAEIAECSRCQALNVKEIAQKSHVYGEATTVDKTCTTDGYTKEVCTLCGFTNITNIDKAIDHVLSETKTDATCVSVGYKKITCANCDYEKTEILPATGVHTYPDTWETVAEATCVGHGVEKRVCTVCNSATETRLTDLADHTAPADWTTEAEAWCGVEGRRVKDCTVCGKELDSEAIPALEHNYEAYPDASYTATCTSAGADAEKCSRCGDINTTVIQPSGHKYENEGAKVTTEADCTHSAFITYDCDNCDYTYTEYVIGSTVKAHTWGEPEEKAADCETDGYIRYECSVCDATKETILSKTGHSYGAWEVEKEATNDEDGQWKRVCTNNPDHIEYVTIPKGDHTFAEDAAQYIAPKCNEKGKRVYKCTAHTDCIAAVTVVLDEVQHTVKQEETAATCTKTGSVKAYCEVCGLVLSTEEIPVKAHDFVAQTPVASTCTTSGYTPYTCACGATYNAYNENDPAKGHDFSVFVSKNDATCTADGKEIYKCSRCGEEQTTVLPKTGHNYEVKSTTSADCTTPATTAYECTGCKDSYTEYDAAANGHTWSDWTETQAATADNYGIKERTCSVCGAVEIDKIAPIGDHVFTETVTKPATCTEDGEKKFICSVHTNCTADYTAKIPATGHDGEIAYTAPTCTTAGSTQIICGVCSAEISDKQIIPAAGHTYDKGVVTLEAGCATTGTKTYTCSCGDSYTETIPAKGHELTTVVNDATCDKAGSVVITCANCNDPAVEKTVELAAKGHIWKDTYESKIDATCETDGSETYKCQFCEATNVVVIPKLGHDWGGWTVIPSTNDGEGSISRTCSRGCTESVKIPAGGHELVIDAENSIDASCSAEGTLVYKCTTHTDCGITVSVSVPKTQHTVAQRESLATCTKTGSVEAYCSVCNVVLSTEEIPVKAHDFVAQTPVAATCTTSGYTPYTCACGDTYNDYDATKPATGHSFVEGTSTASCTAGGVMTLECSACDYETTVDVPALGHDYVEDTTAATSATCAAAATKTYKCSRCDAAYTISEGDKLTGDNVHSWGAWTVKESATATSIGLRTRTCTVCDQLDYEIIPATGSHKFDIKIDEQSQDATCVAAGWEVYGCSTHENCAETSRIELPATGHTETLEYTPATCDAAGSTKMVCSVCGDTIKEEVIPALGHLYGEGTVTNATCTDAGKIEYTCTRENCGATHETVIAKNENAHQYATVVTDSTCAVAGSVVTKCSLCGNITTDKELPKLEHSWNSGEVEDGDAANCTADGVLTYTCTSCGATKTETIEATGHTWGEWTVTKAPTNTETGEFKRTCQTEDCGVSETIEIPAGGHTFGKTPDVTIPATCTTTGTATYNCTAHTGENACGVTITVTLDVLQHELEPNYDKNATCEEDGEVVTKCKNCNTATYITVIPATGHTYDDGVTTAATCTAEGKIVYTCTADNCGTTREVILEKLQHEYGAGVETAPTCTSSGYTTYTCEKCGASYKEIGADAKGHSFDTVVSSTATCLTAGKMTLKCECGTTMTADVPALGHDYKKISSTPADCSAAATETYDCSRCDAAYTISVGDKTENHSWNDWTVVEAADENSIGYETRTCKVCGKVEVKTIQATGEHEFTVETDDKQAPTCTEAGYIVYACKTHTDCGETSKVIVPATGHDEEKTTVYASCTVAGSVTTTCKNCDYEVVEDIPALGHLYEAGTGAVTPATCDAEGKIEYTCTRCNGETKTVIIPVDADAHNYKTTVKQATCVADGSVVTECLICGDTTKETIPATGHSWNSGSVSKEATCEEAGLRTLTCLKCAATSDEVIPALGHTYEAGETVAPTCTTSGYTVYTCKNDSAHTYKVYDEAKPATGHTWSDWSIDTNATETTDGLKVRECACGEKDEQIIPAMMHEMTEIENVPSTCSQAGHITYKCKIDHEGVKCSYTLTVDLPLVAHAFKTTVTEASCKDAGSVLTECTVCDYETTEALALKPHKLTVTTTAATCEDEGSVVERCEVCGETETTTIAALGHDFSGKETIVTPASCSDDGKKTIGCTRCDAVKEIIIPQTAHNFEPKEVVAATCTTSGYTVNRCACGREYNALDSDPIGHSWNKGEITKDATCTTDGEKTFTCTRDNCGATRTEVISKFGHSWGAWEVVVNPTATVDGLQMRKCLRGCGVTDSVVIPALGGTTTYTVTFVADGKVIATQTVVHGGSATAPEIGNKAPDANGHYSFIWDTDFTKVTEDLTVTAVYTQAAHNYGEWITDIEATCKAQGKQHRVCADCSYIQTQTVAVKSHDYSVVKSEKEATCTESGYTVRACSYCGTTTTETTMRLGHTMTYHEYIPETCDTDGSMAYYSCSRCGKNFADRLGKTELTDIVISKKYHTFIVSEGKDPTCTAEGVTDYLYCTSCGFTQNPSSIPALGHVDANKDNACDRCGGTYMEGGEIVCTCNCHKSGIFNELIYKILLFFWRLFGMNKSCACGRVHY